jgi:hypothetical protein
MKFILAGTMIACKQFMTNTAKLPHQPGKILEKLSEHHSSSRRIGSSADNRKSIKSQGPAGP